MLPFLFSTASTFAQASYEDSFCSYYSYTVECYAYWDKAETKITAFVDAYTQKIKSQHPNDAIPKLRTMQDQVATAVQYYKGTHWEYLIRFFADQFVAPIQVLEEELAAIKVDASYISEQMKNAESKDDLVQGIRAMVISQLIINGYDGFNERPFGVADSSGLLNDGDGNKVIISSPVYEQDVLDVYLNDLLSDVSLGDTIEYDISIKPSVYNQRK